MKTEISRDSHQPEKRYSGVYQQQGRMLTDADWNELVDILKERLDDALKDIVGNSKCSIGGTPHHRALEVIKASSGAPLTIKSGYVYVDGVSAQAMPDPAKYTGSPPPEIFEYDKQLDFPSPPVFPTSGSHILYADVWERTVTQLMDARLRDKGLHGADTCTRKQVMAQIKWCPEVIEPEKNEQKNPHRGDAKATIKLLQKSTQPDPCDPCAEKLEVESRVGNYLFRIEVHDVKGPADAPTEITLKWSGENGAIQFPLLKDGQGNDIPPPAHFTAGGWAYEFFDETSERHLGVHHAPAWLPVRSGLVNVYSQPAAAPKQNVRRWDGYCTLQKNGSSWSIGEQYDKDFKESSFASLNGSQLAIKLPAQEIVIKFGQAIMAGDYWLAEVREAEHEPGAELITNAPPCGIGHRYLKLGKVAGGVLQANSEADRKYAFPPLTEMTRMFIAGGDGQGAMPGHILPNPIWVGVANGEWPVTGAKVRFTLESGNGVLSLSGAPSFSPETLPLVVAAVNGLANCYWKVGDGIAPHSKLQRVKAELLGADGNPIAHPPLFFNANLSTADEVAYTPQCMPDADVATVHHLLLGPSLSRLGADGYYTVKEVLDALLCELKAGHIPYDEPACAVTPSVKSLLSVLDINSDGHITVKDVLDTLLCKLSAAHVPYDPAIKGLRWDDVNAEEGVSRPSTVQQAIDDLVDNLQSEDIKYTPSCVGDTPATVRSMLAIPTDTPSRVHEILNKLLCELNAGKIPYDGSSRSSRWDDINETEGSHPQTVQEAIDDLVDNLDGRDIKYTPKDCESGANALKGYLQELIAHAPEDATNEYRINAVLDALLCHLDAARLPYSAGCDFLEGKNTVKEAIDALCNRPSGSSDCDAFLKLFGRGVLCGLVPKVPIRVNSVNKSKINVTISTTPGTVIDGHGCVKVIDNELHVTSDLIGFEQEFLFDGAGVRKWFEAMRSQVFKLANGEVIPKETVAKFLPDVVINGIVSEVTKQAPKTPEDVEAILNERFNVTHSAAPELRKAILKGILEVRGSHYVAVDSVYYLDLISPQGVLPYLEIRGKNPDPIISFPKIASSTYFDTNRAITNMDTMPTGAGDPFSFPVEAGPASDNVCIDKQKEMWARYAWYECPQDNEDGAVRLATIGVFGDKVWICPDAREQIVAPALFNAMIAAARPKVFDDVKSACKPQ